MMSQPNEGAQYVGENCAKRQDDKDWDLAVDPHGWALAHGQVEGTNAGNLAGFQEGRALGHLKGMEFGIELGFIRGVLNAIVVKHEQRSFGRIQKSIRELLQLLDKFPNPHELFSDFDKLQPGLKLDTSLTDKSGNVQEEAGNEDSEEVQSKESRGQNILNQMQVIRARFKLVMVKLGLPHFSLQQVMEEGTAATLEEATQSLSRRAPTTEW